VIEETADLQPDVAADELPAGTEPEPAGVSTQPASPTEEPS